MGNSDLRRLKINESRLNENTFRGFSAMLNRMLLKLCIDYFVADDSFSAVLNRMLLKLN